MVSFQPTLLRFLMVKGRQVIRQTGEATTESKTVIICLAVRSEEKHFLPSTWTSSQGRGEKRNNQRHERPWNQTGSGGQDPKVALAQKLKMVAVNIVILW